MSQKNLISYSRFHDAYALLVLISILGTGIFGIRPSLNSWLEKRTLLNELKAENTRLESSISSFKEKRYISKEVEPYLPELESAVPSDFTGSTIITEFLSLASRNRFRLRKVNISQGSGDNNTISLAITLEGRASGLSSFLRSLDESPLNFIVETYRLSFTSASREQNIDLRIKMFVLEKDRI